MLLNALQEKDYTLTETDQHGYLMFMYRDRQGCSQVSNDATTIHRIRAKKYRWAGKKKSSRKSKKGDGLVKSLLGIPQTAAWNKILALGKL